MSHKIAILHRPESDRNLDLQPENKLQDKGVITMLSAACLLMLGSMMYSLRLSGSGGSFPKPLTAEEERHYLERAATGDLEARNVLIERNLRLVAHIMNKG